MHLRGLYVATLGLAAGLCRGVGEIIAPNGCAFCGVDLAPTSAPVCDGCYGDLPWVEPRFHLEPFNTAVTPLEYAFPIDAAIKRLKFRRKLFYAPALSHLLAATLHELPDDIDALLPMPLHWRRRASRGFNQAHEVAKGINRLLRLPVIGAVRRRHTPYQSGLTASQRRRNVRRAFEVRASLAFRHALLVDDVITTGASCRELARVILEAGVERVSVLAIARAMRD